MKKVLIIGFLHPYTIPGGSFRTLPLAKYLPEFGWEPVVLTPFLKEKTVLPFRVLETPYRDAQSFLKRILGFNPETDVKSELINRSGTGKKNTVLNFLLTRAGEILNYPDSHKGWWRFALESAETLLKNEKIDAMITCHPTISHIIGSRLKQKYNIPWIADFPDLWSQNHNYGYSPLRKMIDNRLEKKTLLRADVLTTVSLPWADKLKALHVEKKVYPIIHGFDPTEVNKPPVSLTEKFTITYTGMIYKGKQDPTKLFVAIRDLISEKKLHKEDIKIRFFGPTDVWWTKKIIENGLSDVVQLYGNVSKGESIRRQRESQILLYLNWIDSKERGVYAGKIFEYLAARRPVLAIDGSEDVIYKLLVETNAGITAYSLQELKATIFRLYELHKRKRMITYEGKEEKINDYSYIEMTRKFSEILERIS